jgi:hypothetical protein
VGADGTGNQDQVFKTGIALSQRPAHEIVPALAGGDRDACAIVAGIDLDPARGHHHDTAVVVAGEKHVAAFAEHQCRRIQRGQQFGQRAGIIESGKLSRLRIHAQGVVRGEAGVLRNGPRCACRHAHAAVAHWPRMASTHSPIRRGPR